MEQTLENGLQVILKKDKRAPVVTSHIWYKIGSADEYSGKTGLSHALEHMMFKGTKKYPSGIFFPNNREAWWQRKRLHK